MRFPNWVTLTLGARRVLFPGIGQAASLFSLENLLSQELGPELLKMTGREQAAVNAEPSPARGRP